MYCLFDGFKMAVLISIKCVLRFYIVPEDDIICKTAVSPDLEKNANPKTR